MTHTHEITTTPSGRKTYLTTPNPYSQFLYHRAVKKGPFIYVSGTTSLKLPDEIRDGSQTSLTAEMLDSIRESRKGEKEGGDDGRQKDRQSNIHACGDAYGQAIIAMGRCVDAVERLGGRVEDIVRVRMYVGKSDHCGDVGEAFRECFGASNKHADEVSEIGAAATMVVMENGFVDEDIAVEVEVDAVVL